MDDLTDSGMDLREILRIARELHRCIGARLREAGLRKLGASHGEIMVNLSHRGPLSPKEIAGLTGHDASTVTALVGKLMRLGYVESKPHPEDGRSKIISMTDEGRSHHNTVEDHIDELTTRLCRDIPAADWSAFLRVIDHIQHELEHELPGTDADTRTREHSGDNQWIKNRE